MIGEQGQQLVNRQVANDAWEVRGVVNRCGKVRGAAIEACCGAADLAEELIRRDDWPVQLAHPGNVARIKQSPDKTDFADARLLADLVRVGYLPKVWLAPEELRQLRRLVRHRQQLVDTRRNVKLRIRGLLRENRMRAKQMNAWTKRWLTWVAIELELSEDDRWLMNQHLSELAHLSEQIRAVEKRLAQRAESDPVIQKLLSYHGVGLVTALTLRAEVGHFDRFQTGKQLARFCGVSPQRQQRSTSGRRRIDQSGQSATAPRADRTGPSAHLAVEGSLGQAGVTLDQRRQTEKRGGRRRGQPPGPLSASSNATSAIGRPTTLAPARRKGLTKPVAKEENIDRPAGK